MRNPTRNRNQSRLLRKTTAAGLALVVVLAGLPSTAAAKTKSDWSRVQAVPHNTKAVVWLYQDAAPRESRRIKGRFDSATDDSITLVLKDGQTRTVRKEGVRKVLIPRPFKKRWPGWVTAAVTTAIWVPVMGVHSDFHAMGILLFGGLVSFAPSAIAFAASGMGPVYNVPPRLRTRPQGDQQSPD